MKRVFFRVFRDRCPRCGQGRILKSFFNHEQRCLSCQWKYVSDPVDFGMLMYISTAAVTGLFVVGYLMIGFPTTGWHRLIVLILGLGLMIGTASLRRRFAIGILYLSYCLFDVPEGSPEKPEEVSHHKNDDDGS